MKTVAIDFDGVIHQYSKGWQDGTCYDIPVMDAFDSIRQLQDEGYSVFILSTRKAESIYDWLQKHKAPFAFGVMSEEAQFWNVKGIVGITNKKLPAHVYIDDRAILFKGNWGDIMGTVTGFKTWQEDK